jgi:outer membrane lipoprotein SlyB
MIMKKAGLIVALPLSMALGACSSTTSPNSYESRSVGQVSRVERGTIESYRWVEIRNSKSGIGTVAGAGIGAAAGSTVGSGRGRGAENVIGAIGGALLGGLIGNSIEKSASKKSGFEYIIRTESGALVSLVQTDTNPLPEGAPVIITYSGSGSRVSFDHNAPRFTNDAPPQYQKLPRETDDPNNPKN